jgi:hypothetical protein
MLSFRNAEVGLEVDPALDSCSGTLTEVLATLFSVTVSAPF